MLRVSLVAAAAGLTLLSACSLDVGRSLGLANPTPASTGIVVGDEPAAVQSGAAILAQGGSAADAVTAMYFTMSVTYPVAAGLGGGGVCLVHNAATAAIEEIDFPVHDAQGGGAYAVGGNVRGFALLQADYGSLPWQRDISDAEGLAASGFAISHALEARLVASQAVVRLDASLAHEFLDETGSVKPVDTTVENPDLAATLAVIRTDGPNAFYREKIAEKVIAYSSSEGGTLTPAEFSAYEATTGTPHMTTIGGLTVASPSTPETNDIGAVLASLGGGTSAGEATHATAQWGAGNLPADLGSTAFAARDAHGEAVACAVTMNGPFGSGHTAGDTGVLLARPSSQEPEASAFLAPVIATDGSGIAAFTGGAAGGPHGIALIALALQSLSRGQSVAAAQSAAAGSSEDFDSVNGIVCQSTFCALYTDLGVGRAQQDVIP